MEKPVRSSHKPQLLYSPRLFPRAEAKDIAARATELAFKLTRNQAPEEEMYANFLMRFTRAADKYFDHQIAAAYPSAKEYKTAINGIRRTAQHLLAEIKSTDRKLLWDIARRTRQELSISLRNDLVQRDENSLENILLKFVGICEASSQIEGRAGAPPSPGLADLAKDLAAIWLDLTGKSFPKNLTATQDPIKDPEPIFKSPGACFVREMIRVFNPALTFSEVKTALSSMPVQKKIV